MTTSACSTTWDWIPFDQKTNTKAKKKTTTNEVRREVSPLSMWNLFWTEGNKVNLGNFKEGEQERGSQSHTHNKTSGQQLTCPHRSNYWNGIHGHSSRLLAFQLLKSLSAGNRWNVFRNLWLLYQILDGKDSWSWSTWCKFMLCHFSLCLLSLTALVVNKAVLIKC